MIVLVVDDEEMIRNIGSRVLRKAGFEVLTAESGEKAIECFIAGGPDIGVVIIDYFMKGLGGVVAIRRFREISPSVPCILSSGGEISRDSLPDDLRENSYLLHKPYRADQLATLVRAITGR